MRPSPIHAAILGLAIVFVAVIVLWKWLPPSHRAEPPVATHAESAPPSPVHADARASVVVREAPDPASTLNGTVVDDRGRPIVGAALSLRRNSASLDDVAARATTGADGSFSIAGASVAWSDGSHVLRAEAAGHTPTDVSVSTLDGVRIVLRRVAMLHGVVTSAFDGVGIAGARIAASPSSFHGAIGVATSDANGAYEMHGLPRESSVQFAVRGDGFSPMLWDVPIGSEAVQRYDMALPLDAPRRFRVVDALSHATIGDAVFGHPGAEFGRTDDRGEVALRMPAGDVQFVVRKAGYSDEHVLLRAGELVGVTTPYEVRLDPETAVELRLVNEHRVALVGWTVECSLDRNALPTGDARASTVVARRGVTDANGLVTIGNLESGTPYRVRTGPTARSADMIYRLTTFTTGRAGERTGLGEIRCDVNTGFVSGYVTMGGRSVVGASIQIRHDDTLVASTQSGESGLFHIAGIRPGTYRLLATNEAGADAETFDVVAGRRSHVNPILDRARFQSTIGGIVSSSDGRSLQGVTIQARTTNGEIVGEGASRGGGEFSIALTVPQGVAIELGQRSPFGWQSIGLGITGAADLALVVPELRKGYFRARLTDTRVIASFVVVEVAEPGTANFEPHPVHRTCSIGGGGGFVVTLPPQPDASLRIRRSGASDSDAWTVGVAHVSTDPDAPTVVDLR